MKNFVLVVFFLALILAGTTTLLAQTVWDDPLSLTVKNATGAVTLDGKLDESDWAGAPTLVFGMGAHLKKLVGEYTVTSSADVKNGFDDAGVKYYIPHKDSTVTRVKFLRKGTNLYIGIQSNDKSICKFDWEGDGMFMKIKTLAGQEKEYKLYWQNIEANKDTIRYEEGVAGSGDGKGYLLTGSTVNDTANTDNGYTAEMVLQLDKLGYASTLTSVQLLINIFDPDGFKHPMSSWHHTIGSFYKSWWGSEWGGTMRTLNFTAEPFDDPPSLTVKNATGGVTLDGKLDESDWTGAPTLVFGMGAHLKKLAGEYTVTSGADVKNGFDDAGVKYYVPHKDSTVTRVKFLRKGTNLYIGIQSNDKSICKFDWEGDGMFMKIKTLAGQEKEYKLYWQNIEANKDTMRYEEGVAGSGDGKGFLLTGSTVNDTTNVDNGYTAELMLQLDKLGYATSSTTAQVSIDIFDPDGFKHPMSSWHHTIGSFYKSWWGSEWGSAYRTLLLNNTTDVRDEVALIPDVFSLSQNYPNPFNPSTTIQYGIPERSTVALKVHDVIGREIATLVNEELPAGTHRITFNASTLASGFYFYRLVATPRSSPQKEPFITVKKLLLIK
ncbi:MAG: T9SS type A sorting domain-containing protein [bacterium]